MADYSVYSDPFLNQWATNASTPFSKLRESATGGWGPPYPVTQAPQPTSDWWNSISPDVRSGIWQPYQEAGNQMMEKLGSVGQLGNPRGGASGVAGMAMSELAAKAGQQAGLQGWNMMQPGAMAQYALENQAIRDPFSLTPSYLGAGSSYGSTLIGNQPGQDISSQLMRYGMLGYLGTSALGGVGNIASGLGSAYNWLTGAGTGAGTSGMSYMPSFGSSLTGAGSFGDFSNAFGDYGNYFNALNYTGGF
jgi:hypothetical protein